MKGTANNFILAIDGPSGVGKSTTSRRVAKELGFKYLDTGAMYRAIAVFADAEGVDIEDDSQLSALCERAEITFDESGERVFVNGIDYSEKIRTPLADDLSSKASQKQIVRDCLVRLQREFGERSDIVVEGRDIGTVVFPSAQLKIFLDASSEVRAARRHGEAREGGTEDIKDVTKGITIRDERDKNRKASPLKEAEDAVRIDTSELTIDEVVEEIEEEVRKRR